MLFSNRTLTIALFGLTLFSTNNYAEQSYQAELSGSYEKVDADTTTEKNTTLTAEIYFSPVNTEKKPLAKAAFLDKSSSIGLGYLKSKIEFQNANANANSLDVTIPLITINYITENSAFILGAAYSKATFDTNNNFLTGDAKIASINIGKYLNDSSTLIFSYTASNTDFQVAAQNQSFSIDSDQYALAYNTVQALGGGTFYSFGASIDLIKSDTNSVKENNREIAVIGEYYFNRMTNLGAGASFNSGDDILQEGKTFAVSAAHFFTPQIALNVNLSKFLADDDQEEDSTSVSADIIARF